MFTRWLPEASANAGEIDFLIGGLVLVSIGVLALVFGLMFVFLIRYRHNSPIKRHEVEERSFYIEMSWTAATLAVFFGLFIWGSFIYVHEFQVPRDAMKIYVVAKQWMWKAEYPGGQHEIDSLHVPVNKPVMLVMASQDVIHSFFVPEFRLKRDVLPGQYQTLWFRADRPGTYHLFCSQFCGTAHAAMIGTVTAMTGPDFEKWLSNSNADGTLAAEGRSLFVRFGCAGCHLGNSSVRAPSLNGLYGSPVPLSDGSVVTADDRYIRDSILYPKKQIVAGFEPVMPSFQNLIGEEDLVKLVAYIESLATEPSR